MTPALQRQLRRLDAALLALLDERARLAQDCSSAGSRWSPALEDLLRRYCGPTSADDLRTFFAAVERASRPRGERQP